MPKLVKFEKDCSDEFDVYGFIVTSDERWEKYEKMFEHLEFPIEMSFGGNDFLVFEDVNDIKRSTDVVDITIDEKETFITLFKPSYQENDEEIEFGWTPYSDMISQLKLDDIKSIFGEI